MNGVSIAAAETLEKSKGEDAAGWSRCSDGDDGMLRSGSDVACWAAAEASAEKYAAGKSPSVGR